MPTETPQVVDERPRRGRPPNGLRRAPDPVSQFERALGGRAQVAAGLALDTTPAIQDLVALLRDPAYRRLSLAQLAAQSKVSLRDLLVAYRNATLATAQVLATTEIAKRLQELAADVMIRALPTQAPCPVCRGTLRMPGKTQGTRVACTACDATGTVIKAPSVQRQRLALEIAELLRPPNGRPAALLQQQINIAASASGGPTTTTVGSLDQLQRAVTSILYDREPAGGAGPVIDAEPAAPAEPVAPATET